MASSSSEQRLQLFWAGFHLLVSFGVARYNSTSLAANSLAKCITFDAFGIASTAVFAILAHYPVWADSSIRHPFGLKRAEVIVRFAAAVFLTYSGIELVREVVERLAIGGGHGHGPSDDVHLDPHALNDNDYMPLSMLVTILVTLLSAVVFQNHAQLSQALDLDSAPRVLRNPFYLLTMVPSVLLLVISITDMHLHAIVDRTIAACIAGALAYIGLVLIYRLGSILLMTYPSKSVGALYQAVENDDAVVGVEGKVWQVWTGLVVVALRVSVRGGEAVEGRVRERVTRYARDILGGGYGSGKALKFDVRVECERS